MKSSEMQSFLETDNFESTVWGGYDQMKAKLFGENEED